MPAIHFKTTLFTIGDSLIFRLPEEESAKLPSRSQAMVEGTINGHEFKNVLEPDGKWSHWFRLDEAMQKKLGVGVGDEVEVAIDSTKDWIEPTLPSDLRTAVEGSPEARAMWAKITPMARWEWLRWVNGTKNPDTRKHRIEVSISKMKKGMRRPCCFNRAMCTDPYVSKSGRLLEPENVAA
jgi:hypothetical protein